MKRNKKGGVIGNLISGTGSLVILVVLVLVIVSTLLGANLLTGGSAEDNAATNLSSNLSSGINEVSAKIPTILKIAAIVLLIGVLMLLVRNAKFGNMGGGSGTL